MRALTAIARWPHLMQLGVLAIVLITTQTLILHGATGRHTPTPMAFAWSLATVAAWGLALMPALFALRRWSDRVRHRRIMGALIAVVGTMLVIAVAGALRAAIDPWIPTLAPPEWIAERSFMVRARDYWLRWLGPGTLFCMLLLVLRLRAEAAPQAHTASSPSDARPADTSADTSATFPSHITVRVGESQLVVPTASIAWCEADGNYVRLHLMDQPADQRPIIARIPLGQLAAMLDPHRFVRVHRSIVVAVDQVVELRSPRDRGATVVLRSGAIAPVSRDGRRLLRLNLGPSN
ncbi:LytTR family DNA binding protein [Gemmatimonas aurantiaca T-27]|uniref:LytTR family DNA binding protein n=2 Tax=Gemmatimonas aurantiaca TaxID=173480 RepID=C1A9H2_GEMAT|nr:LytTR family DNA-binding domain-containing protein [Gemmatimonas aurantiaca]BAH39149.1 LytTR family DNA binding protein [Gemmatimonas aurantiaca T-27]